MQAGTGAATKRGLASACRHMSPWAARSASVPPLGRHQIRCVLRGTIKCMSPPANTASSVCHGPKHDGYLFRALVEILASIVQATRGASGGADVVWPQSAVLRTSGCRRSSSEVAHQHDRGISSTHESSRNRNWSVDTGLVGALWRAQLCMPTAHALASLCAGARVHTSRQIVGWTWANPAASEQDVLPAGQRHSVQSGRPRSAPSALQRRACVVLIALVHAVHPPALELAEMSFAACSGRLRPEDTWVFVTRARGAVRMRHDA